jgi:hypothetical protein
MTRKCESVWGLLRAIGAVVRPIAMMVMVAPFMAKAIAMAVAANGAARGKNKAGRHKYAK